jgi:carnitine-CoA ligase
VAYTVTQSALPTGDRDLSSLFDRLARLRGDRAALHWVPFEGEPQTWTYGELVRDVRRMAAGMQRRGLRRGDRVVLLMDNCPEFVLVWAAVALAGGVAVCLNTRSSRDELGYYFRHATPVGAVVGEANAEDLSAAMPDLRWVAVSGPGADSIAGLLGDEASWRPPAVDPMQPASIQYTSGTTARPKAVVWTHANCLWAGQVGASHQGLRGDDVNLVHLPLFHTNALSYSLLSTLWAGATLVLQPKFSASRFWDVSARYRCTWSSVVSFCIRALAKHEAPSAQGYRGWGNSYCIPAGEGPGGVPAMGWFGMTETVTHPVVGDPAMLDPAGCMGRPAAEYGVAVVDDSDEPVGLGETGKLLVRGVPGVSLFAGYLGDATATAEAYTEDGWFRTGDRVRLDVGGTLTFIERDKDVLKVGSENVGALEIERVLLQVPGVREAAVVGRPDLMLGEVPVAFVVADIAAEEVLRAIDASCTALLPAFKRPREVRLVGELPKATLDKVAKARLRLLVQTDPGA